MKTERTKNNHINADLSLKSMILIGEIVWGCFFFSFVKLQQPAV